MTSGGSSAKSLRFSVGNITRLAPASMATRNLSPKPPFQELRLQVLLDLALREQRELHFIASSSPESGERVALRPPPPLGTVLESFPSYGSSRDKALREQDRSVMTV